MSEVKTTVTVTITIQGQEIALTLEEARTLYSQLGAVCKPQSEFKLEDYLKPSIYKGARPLFDPLGDCPLLPYNPLKPRITFSTNTKEN